ncbi:MAG: hypothetical protein JJ992_06020, partial [Planctomycetes bacterium]|nr:hypothetical protein [Planctomycetota bacterium]
MRLIRCFALLVLAVPGIAVAQSEVSAEPTVGLRDHRPREYALVNAEVMLEPGVLVSQATILVEGTSITAVGQSVDVPPGFEVIDCTGKRVYPGLIDAWSEQEV